MISAACGRDNGGPGENVRKTNNLLHIYLRIGAIAHFHIDNRGTSQVVAVGAEISCKWAIILSKIDAPPETWFPCGKENEHQAQCGWRFVRDISRTERNTRYRVIMASITVFAVAVQSVTAMNMTDHSSWLRRSPMEKPMQSRSSITDRLTESIMKLHK